MKRWEREYLDYSDPVVPVPKSPRRKALGIKNSARRELALDLRIYGVSRKDVAAHLGVSLGRADQLVAHARRDLEWKSWAMWREWKPGCWFADDSRSSTGLRVVESNQ